MNAECLTAKRAWAGLALGVLVYDILCNKGETMSEGIDRALERSSLLTHMAVGAVALHLLNVPERLGHKEIDPIRQIVKLGRSLGGRAE